MTGSFVVGQIRWSACPRKKEWTKRLCVFTCLHGHTCSIKGLCVCVCVCVEQRHVSVCISK